MRTSGPTARAVLEILDPERGGVFAPTFGFIVLKLEDRGIDAEKTALYHILRRLREDGKIVRIKTKDGGALFVHSEYLHRFPQVVASMSDSPALSIRHREGTSERALNLR
jgi:Fe2+ or Zn2+ uptake regulation protein